MDSQFSSFVRCSGYLQRAIPSEFERLNNQLYQTRHSPDDDRVGCVDRIRRAARAALAASLDLEV